MQETLEGATNYSSSSHHCIPDRPIWLPEPRKAEVLAIGSACLHVLLGSALMAGIAFVLRTLWLMLVRRKPTRSHNLSSMYASAELSSSKFCSSVVLGSVPAFCAVRKALRIWCFPEDRPAVSQLATPACSSKPWVKHQETCFLSVCI